MDPADYPYRVLKDDRLHALLIGPAVSGKTALGLHLARQGRKVLTVAPRQSVENAGDCITLCGKLTKGSILNEQVPKNKLVCACSGCCEHHFLKGIVFQTHISP